MNEMQAIQFRKSSFEAALLTVELEKSMLARSGQLLVPGGFAAGNRGAHFVRPCPVALRRNKALHQTAQPSSLQLAAHSAGERRD